VRLEHFPIQWNREVLQISLLSHVLFGKPVSTHRVKPEGMLFRDMLQIIWPNGLIALQIFDDARSFRKATQPGRPESASARRACSSAHGSEIPGPPKRPILTLRNTTDHYCFAVIQLTDRQPSWILLMPRRALTPPSTDMKRLLARIADAANETAASETGGHSPVLVFVIACQLFAVLILLLRAQGAPLLALEDMNLMPPWGP
jgi:hypothetical protein